MRKLKPRRAQDWAVAISFLVHEVTSVDPSTLP